MICIGVQHGRIDGQNVGVQPDVRELPGLARGSRQHTVLAAQRRDGVALNEELEYESLGGQGKQRNEALLLANSRQRSVEDLNALVWPERVRLQC